jgi:RNA 2',3'-cyclic 3'-phosphodiesterase
VNAAGTPHALPPLRLFFALWPSAAEQQALARATAACTTASPGRLIPGANLHVTLAFLGNVAAACLPQLRALGLQTSAAWPDGAQALQLQFRTVEHWARPQILCATADPQSVRGAGALAGRIRQAAVAAGFLPDLKPFHAHVTVARKVVHAPAQQRMPAVTWRPDAFALVASVTAAAGSLYSVVETYPLDRSENARK